MLLCVFGHFLGVRLILVAEPRYWTTVLYGSMATDGHDNPVVLTDEQRAAEDRLFERLAVEDRLVERLAERFRDLGVARPREPLAEPEYPLAVPAPDAQEWDQQDWRWWQGYNSPGMSSGWDQWSAWSQKTHEYDRP